LRKPVSAIANTSISATEVFPNATAAEKKILAYREDGSMVEAASNFLLGHRPPSDPHVGSTRRAVEEIASDRGVTRVQHLVARCGIQERTLQRLFGRYVGASPR